MIIRWIMRKRKNCEGIIQKYRRGQLDHYSYTTIWTNISRHCFHLKRENWIREEEIVGLKGVGGEGWRNGEHRFIIIWQHTQNDNLGAFVQHGFMNWVWTSKTYHIPLGVKDPLAVLQSPALDEQYTLSIDWQDQTYTLRKFNRLLWTQTEVQSKPTHL